jgi:hypothetical protein
VASLISASRRTDIPHFFGSWFAERRKAGFATYRNAFGGEGRASLRDQDVVGYLFWTKYGRPFADQLRALRGDGVPFAFQYTITGYGAEIETGIPHRARAIDDFLAIAGQLPDPACIQWRFDPIVLSGSHDVDFHLKSFAAIARSIRGATRVVNVSIVEPYAKAFRRLADPTVCYRRADPARHRWVARRRPKLREVGAEVEPMLSDLAAIARDHGMELRSCANPEWALPQSQCCAEELFGPYGEAVAQAVVGLPPAPTRSSCRCLRSVDIGMDNTCLGGCRYCYVVSSHQLAVASFQSHQPTRPSLR